MRSTRKGRKRLRSKSSCQPTRCIMAALMSIGGGQGILPAVAAAQETTIDSDAYQDEIIYGNNNGDPKTSNDDANGNTITVTAGHIVRSIYGGHNSDNPDEPANDNTLIMDGTVKRNAYGGKSDAGTANGNTVNISGTILTETGYGFVYGGVSESNTANHNDVTITGNVSGGSVYGGNSTSGNAEWNTVTVDGGGHISQSSAAGRSVEGKAMHNTFTLKNGTTSTIAGGRTTSGTAEQNDAIIEGGSAFMAVGADAENGIVNTNRLTIKGGTITVGAYGGLINSILLVGHATNNTIDITNGTINGDVAGGLSHKGNATGNTINVSGGTINISEDLFFAGGRSTDSKADNNTINMHGGTINVGTGILVAGGYSVDGTANNNTINMDGGKITGGVAAGRSVNNSATGNTINLYDLDGISDYINGTIQGGAGTTSSDNTLNFLGTANLPNATLDGSTIQNLNVYTTSNSVKDITGNIGNMHFYLPANISNGDTMLTVSNGIETNLDNTTINWSSASMPNLSDGEKVTLIYNANNLSTNGTILPAPRSYLRTTGISNDTTYTFTTEREDTKAIVIRTSTKTTTGDGVTLPARTRSLVETRTAMTSLLNGGSDFVATQVMDEAEAVAIDPEISVVYGRLVPFAVFGGGSLNLDTGADVDLNSYYVNLGLTKEIKNRNGSLYLGPILEYGHGSYDSYSDNSVHGWGKGHYVGGGFFFRQRNHDGLYYEGDLRAGRVKSDYQGNLAEGLNADYTNSGSYIAGHLGFGKIFQLNKTDTMDTYLRYFYTRTSGEEVNIHSNMNEEMFNFDSVNSHRLRIGARYYHALNERSKLYAGLAYQYEFSGEATATHDGLSAPSTSLKGSSGMAELGWKVTSNQKVPMTVDLGVTAWAGKQKGVMGRLKLSWAF